MKQRLASLPRLWAFLGVLGLAADRQLEATEPTIASGTRRCALLASMAVNLAAAQLATASRDHAAPVQQLATMAGRRRKDLRRAAADIRMAGWSEELARDNLANRLLLAAASGEAVVPFSDEEERWFDATRMLDQEPATQVFTRLAKAQPGLLDIERDLRNAVANGEFAGGNRSELVAADEAVRNALSSLLGPGSDAGDPILHSRLAFDKARGHIMASCGFAGFENY